MEKLSEPLKFKLIKSLETKGHRGPNCQPAHDLLTALPLSWQQAPKLIYRPLNWKRTEAGKREKGYRTHCWLIWLFFIRLWGFLRISAKKDITGQSCPHSVLHISTALRFTDFSHNHSKLSFAYLRWSDNFTFASTIPNSAFPFLPISPLLLNKNLEEFSLSSNFFSQIKFGALTEQYRCHLWFHITRYYQPW